MERLADRLDLEHLKKISAVCMSDPERVEYRAQDQGQGEEEGEGEEVVDVSQTLSEMTSELGKEWCGR